MNKSIIAITSLFFISSTFFAGSACKGEIEGGEAPPPKAKKKKSNVKQIKRAVPVGKQLACATVFPDVAPFTAALGEEHAIGSILDRSKSNSNSTFTCSLIKAGEPPASPKELKTLEDKYSKLGVLPGDEYCQITAYCSSFNDDKSIREKCEKNGNSSASLEGQFACVRATPKGVDYSYTYMFIEPDTDCTMEVMAGPSVSEDAIVRSCALAAKDLMTKASLSAN